MTEPLADRIQDIAREIRGPDDEGRLMFNTLYDIGEQVAALTAERDGLRVKVRDVAWAALKYEDATYRVKTYPSNGQYKRQLKKIHDILKAAQAEFATTGEQK